MKIYEVLKLNDFYYKKKLHSCFKIFLICMKMIYANILLSLNLIYDCENNQKLTISNLFAKTKT